MECAQQTKTPVATPPSPLPDSRYEDGSGYSAEGLQVRGR
jgi:hypothetical protein